VLQRDLSTTDIPVLSEEGKDIPYETRKGWARLWIVDPLDGTKEFIQRNGQFTVNVALVEHGYPILGVIYVPVTRELYFAGPFGAFVCAGKSEAELLALAPDFAKLCAASVRLPAEPRRQTRVRIVASRSHSTPETEAFIAEQEKVAGPVELVSLGSSLKICLVAEGKADLYPRYAPTMEWDTAAGQAIAEAAGATFTNVKTGQRMHYNRENLRNDGFLVR
jgi:3'(2'), 5'-bisphosphate nucleotidase